MEIENGNETGPMRMGENVIEKKHSRLSLIQEPPRLQDGDVMKVHFGLR